MKNYFNHNYGFIVLLCFGILYIPISFYTFNAKELCFDYFLLLVPLIFAAITIIFGYLFVKAGSLLLKNFNQINLHVQNVLAAVGLVVFFNDIFIPTETPALDGSLRKIPESIMFSSIEIVIALIIFISVIYIGPKKSSQKTMLNLSYFSMIFLLLVFMMSGYTTVLNYKHESVHDAFIKYANAPSNSIEKQPNVYLIWLDEMQTEYFTKYIEKNDTDSDFPGFTLFKNNSSNYLYTGQSYPSFVSGTIFKGGDYMAWSLDDRMRPIFKSHGYNITTYAKADFLSPLDDRRVSEEQIFKNATGVKHPYFSDYFVFWLVRSAPNFLANEVFSAATKIRANLDNFINPAPEGIDIRTIADGIEPFTGVKILEKLTEDESQRQGFGELVIAQAIIPHGPYVIDKDCSYRGVEHSIPISDKYYDQVVCSGKLTIKFLDELKHLNRYDTSLIVVFGDHGSGWAEPIEGKDSRRSPLNGNFMPWNRQQVLSRVSALLMIKPPKTSSSDKFKISARESQLIDILPTILDLMGWRDIFQDHHGRNVFSSNHAKREKIFTYFAPANNPNFNEAEIYDILFEPSNGLRDLALISSFNSYFNIARPSIEIEENIDFSATGKSDPYIHQGWSAQEPTHRWTKGPRAVIKAKLIKRPRNDLTLRLNANAFPSDGKGPQVVGVLVNGKKVYEWQMLSLAWYEAPIPADLVADGLLEVVFEISNPTAPCEVSSSEDCRKLGIAARKLIITEQKAGR